MSLLRMFKLANYGRRYLGRMRQGRRQVMRHLHAPHEHPVPMPTFVQLRVTNLCNLRCKMCGQWGDTGIYRAQAGGDSSDGKLERNRIKELIGLRRQLALTDYVRLLDELQPHRPVIGLFGGEPFLYPDIMPLMWEVKKRGLMLTIITNGGQLAQHAEELVELGIDSIAVSLDGTPEVHNTIRGRHDSFQRAAEGIRAVAEARHRKGKGLPLVVAILPLTELNVHEFPEALEAVRALPLDAVNVGLRWFVPKEVGADYERVMQKELGSSGQSWKGFNFSWPGDALNDPRLQPVIAELERVRRRRAFEATTRKKPWVTFLPNIRPADIPRYFSDHRETFGHNLCPVAWYFAQIEPDGDVCFCGDFPDYVIGNVRQQSLREVWYGPKAEAFRAKLAKEPLPICSRCCGSFVHGKWERPALPVKDSPAAPAPVGQAAAPLPIVQ